MGLAFKASWVLLRCLQLIFAAVVVGLVGEYLHLAQVYHASTNSYLIYTQVIAVLSVIIALVFGFPWRGAFWGFPLDFAMFILWMIAFGLQVHLAGGRYCNSDWYWHNWGWFWGQTVRVVPVNLTQAEVGSNGCSAMRTVWAFSFIDGWIFFLGGVAGAYGAVHERRKLESTTDYAARDRKGVSSNNGNPGLNGEKTFNTNTEERV